MSVIFPSNKILPIGQIREYPSNARTHSAAQVAQIAASVREWGWTNPLIVDEADMLIAGHGRLAAAQQLGMAEVPAIVIEGLNETQKRALRLADNKLALNAGWDDGLLRTELEALRTDAFDLALTGFGEDELASLFADRTDGLTDPDAVPEPPAEPITRAGDVWLLGRHRLVCGDATSEVDVSLALASVRPHLMVTDPPYGVDYDPEWRVKAPGLWTTNGYVAPGRVENDLRVDWREVWLLFPGDVAYVWHAGLHGSVVQDSLSSAEFVVRSQIIWMKPHPPISRGDYHWQHEPCWYAVRKGKVGHYVGGRKQSTVWQINNNTFQGMEHGGKGENARTGHGTQKPVECMKRPIENNSSPGQAVYDPFVGSGTTIIAAEMTGRACHAIEISPQYCDVAVTRWQNFTGQTATNPEGAPFGTLAEIPTL